jgi:hypothetical protein
MIVPAMHSDMARMLPTGCIFNVAEKISNSRQNADGGLFTASSSLAPTMAGGARFVKEDTIQV